MRTRIVLGLLLPLVLAACDGGGLLTRPALPLSPTAPPPSATQTLSAIVPLATPEPTLTPDGAEPATVGGTPEIVASLVPAPDGERYLQLLAALRARDELAADWLTRTGLVVSDAVFDAQEQRLLDMLQSGKGDAVWSLVHARTMDGLSEDDTNYFEKTEATPSDNWFFDDDIRGLEAAGAISPNGRRSLQRIFDKARADPEVRLGLYLINAIGVPDGPAYKYPVPEYNLQLYLLARLLEQGVPGEYERATVATALTYGSLMTLCDPPARDRLANYAGERLRSLIDTDVLLAAGGASWRSTEYPLEMLMVTLWGGQTFLYPRPGVPIGEAQSLRMAAAEQPFTNEDLDRILLSMDSLHQMQDEMMNAVVEQSSSDATCFDLLEQWWSTQRRDEADNGGPDMNQQWARYRGGAGFAGGAESAYVLQALAASINLPVPWVQLWYAQDGKLQTVPFGFRLDLASRQLRLGDSAQRAIARLPEDTRAVLVGWRLPWDNGYLGEEARFCQTLPLPVKVWRSGVPAGYLLRRRLLREEEALGALGVAAPAAKTVE